MAASCEQGNGSADFIEGRKYLFFLSDYQLLIGTRVHGVSYKLVTKTGCITLVSFTFRTLHSTAKRDKIVCDCGARCLRA
jgi:hypothetical protein